MVAKGNGMIDTRLFHFRCRVPEIYTLYRMVLDIEWIWIY
jgi:hypothetical protein